MATSEPLFFAICKALADATQYLRDARSRASPNRRELVHRDWGYSMIDLCRKEQASAARQIPNHRLGATLQLGTKWAQVNICEIHASRHLSHLLRFNPRKLEGVAFRNHADRAAKCEQRYIARGMDLCLTHACQHFVRGTGDTG